MPFEIRKQNGQWCVYNKITGENKGCSDTEEMAHKHMDALYANSMDRALELVIELARGGPGSGNFDHAGRPGEVGGSAALQYSGVKVINSLAEASYDPNGFGRAAWISPEGVMFDAGRDHHENTARDFLAENPDLENEKTADQFSGASQTLISHDFIRVRDFGAVIGFTTKTVDTPHLRQLQALFDEDRIPAPMRQDAKIEWGDLSAIETEANELEFDPLYISVTYADFMSAKYASVDYGQIKLRIERGGEGSGNFDHAGRPGEVGGSAPSSIESYHYSGSFNVNPDGHNLREVDKAIFPKTSYPYAAYLIGPDNEVYTGDLGHDGMAYEILEQDIYRIAGGDQAIMESIPQGGMGRMEWLLEHTDVVRIDQNRNETAVQTRDLDKHSLYRIQELVDNDRLELGKTVKWEGNFTHNDKTSQMLITATHEEFMSARHVRWDDQEGPVLRMAESAQALAALSCIVRIARGGEGSGNFDHAGRPGEVGGSVSIRVEGGSEKDRSNIIEALKFAHQYTQIDPFPVAILTEEQWQTRFAGTSLEKSTGAYYQEGALAIREGTSSYMMREVAVHEYGHQVWDRMTKDAQWNFIRFYDSEQFQRTFQNQYAATNEKEGFAESFKLYVAFKDSLSVIEDTKPRGFIAKVYASVEKGLKSTHED